MNALSLRARHLKAHLWGQPEGPRHYTDLPEELRDIARAVDRIGDDLALARTLIFQEGDDPDNLVMQVNLLAHVLAFQVLPRERDDVPDPGVVWVRSDLEGPTFSSAALDGALHYLALGGEPNTWRVDVAVGKPSLKDVRAMQLIATTITDATIGFDAAGITPTQLVEDFVRMHWCPDPREDGLRIGWEDTPLGHAIFNAANAVSHIPAEEAEISLLEPPGPNWNTTHPPSR